jgi:hypothetical protein
LKLVEVWRFGNHKIIYTDPAGRLPCVLGISGNDKDFGQAQAKKA